MPKEKVRRKERNSAQKSEAPSQIKPKDHCKPREEKGDESGPSLKLRGGGPKTAGIQPSDMIPKRYSRHGRPGEKRPGKKSDDKITIQKKPEISHAILVAAREPGGCDQRKGRRLGGDKKKTELVWKKGVSIALLS